VAEGSATELVCGRCGTTRPPVCQDCGGRAFKALRLGVSRAREELEVLAGRPVVEVTGTSPDIDPTTTVLLGTEAVLHRVRTADVVCFVDLDQELLAPRVAAAEQALGLIARAARMVGRRSGGGRVVLQTRTPQHAVVSAAVGADPTLVNEAEREVRSVLRYPPYAAVARISGASAPAYVEQLVAVAALEVLGPTDGAWLVRATDRMVLADGLAAVERPPGRLRIDVDPVRL